MASVGKSKCSKMHYNIQEWTPKTSTQVHLSRFIITSNGTDWNFKERLAHFKDYFNRLKSVLL